MLASRPEPLIYTAWLAELQRGLLADELGDELFQSLAAPNVPLMMRILRDKPGWCDDGGTRADRDLRRRDRAGARPRARLDRAPAGCRHRQVAVGPRASRGPSPSAVRRRAAAARHRLGALPVRRRRADAEPRPALLSRRPAVRCRARRRLSRRLRFQRSRQQPLRHPARPVGQHAVAVGAQLRRSLAGRCATSRSPAPAPRPPAPPSARSR